MKALIKLTSDKYTSLCLTAFAVPMYPADYTITDTVFTSVSNYIKASLLLSTGHISKLWTATENFLLKKPNYSLPDLGIEPRTSRKWSR